MRLPYCFSMFSRPHSGREKKKLMSFTIVPQDGRERYSAFPVFFVCQLLFYTKPIGLYDYFCRIDKRPVRMHRPKGGFGVATPTRFPRGKMSGNAKFGTVVESCSKKVADSSVWASADTLDGRGGDSANSAAVFFPYILTTQRRENLAKSPGISCDFFSRFPISI